MENDEKVHENRLRRMAERQGYKLEKSRIRDPRAIGYGAIRLVPRRGQPREFKSIGEVEAFLTR